MSAYGLKIYQEARTAHLERLNDSMFEINLLYRKKYYDFDVSADPENRSEKTGFLSTLKRILFSNVEIIEFNEPMFIRGIPFILSYVIFTKFTNVFRKRRVKIVAYAIENLDVEEKIRSHSRFAFPIIWPAFRIAASYLIGSFDRIAFGTPSAYQEYSRIAPKRLAAIETIVIPALEPECLSCKPVEKTARRVLFLGAFDERKGIVSLMAHWPAIVERVPSASLTIIGKGEFAEEVDRWASARPEVSLILDPPRKRIHQELSRAQFLILLSQASPRWREQVGLPILEGLSHGCRIITTPSTGLAPWLSDNGHLVVEDDIDVTDISNYLEKPVDNLSVIDTLPQEGGRILAEKWLWRP